MSALESLQPCRPCGLLERVKKRPWPGAVSQGGATQPGPDGPGLQSWVGLVPDWLTASSKAQSQPDSLRRQASLGRSEASRPGGGGGAGAQIKEGNNEPGLPSRVDVSHLRSSCCAEPWAPFIPLESDSEAL